MIVEELIRNVVDTLNQLIVKEDSVFNEQIASQEDIYTSPYYLFISKKNGKQKEEYSGKFKY
jgi:hypothetical protein